MPERRQPQWKQRQSADQRMKAHRMKTSNQQQFQANLQKAKSQPKDSESRDYYA